MDARAVWEWLSLLLRARALGYKVRAVAAKKHVTVFRSSR